MSAKNGLPFPDSLYQGITGSEAYRFLVEMNLLNSGVRHLIVVSYSAGNMNRGKYVYLAETVANSGTRIFSMISLSFSGAISFSI